MQKTMKKDTHVAGEGGLGSLTFFSFFFLHFFSSTSPSGPRVRWTWRGLFDSSSDGDELSRVASVDVRVTSWLSVSPATDPPWDPPSSPSIPEEISRVSPEQHLSKRRTMSLIVEYEDWFQKQYIQDEECRWTDVWDDKPEVKGAHSEFLVSRSDNDVVFCNCHLSSREFKLKRETKQTQRPGLQTREWNEQVSRVFKMKSVKTTHGRMKGRLCGLSRLDRCFRRTFSNFETSLEESLWVNLLLGLSFWRLCAFRVETLVPVWLFKVAIIFSKLLEGVAPPFLVDVFSSRTSSLNRSTLAKERLINSNMHGMRLWRSKPENECLFSGRRTSLSLEATTSVWRDLHKQRMNSPSRKNSCLLFQWEVPISVWV